MNDWLDYQGSGSSRAYTNDTLSHASLVPVGSKQYDADYRLIHAYAEKAKKLKSEYKSLESNYNKYVELYNYNKDMAERQESNRAEVAKSGQALRATRFFEKNVWRYKKDASDAKSEADSYLAQMKANIDAQKKLQADVNSIDDSDYQYDLERNSMRKMKANSLFVPDELPSNINRKIKQSYFDMPVDRSVVHAEKGGTSMNDWLDYQGSGSSRAYTNDTLSHAAPVKNSTSGGYDYLNSRLSELSKQEDELVALAGEAANLMNTAYGKLRTAYGKIQLIDKKMATMDKAGWDITESINRGNFSTMQKEALTNKLNSIGKRGQAKLAAMYVPIDTVDDIRSSLRSALSNFTVVGHSYSGMSADEFIEHAAKERVRFRDSINDTIGKVMDKVTDADHKASDAKNKQREAEERLKKAQIERTAKEINDAVDKLRSDAAVVRQEASDYRDKINNTWESLVNQESRAKDPRALAQIDSARRNISNDILRTYDKITSEIIALYREQDKIQNWYNNFVYSYPTSYVKTVPRSLQDSKKYLDEASKANNTVILNREKRIWN